MKQKGPSHNQYHTLSNQEPEDVQFFKKNPPCLHGVLSSRRPWPPSKNWCAIAHYRVVAAEALRSTAWGRAPKNQQSRLYRASSEIFSTFSSVFLLPQPRCAPARPISHSFLYFSIFCWLRVALLLLLHPVAHAAFFAKIGLYWDCPLLFYFSAHRSLIFLAFKLCSIFFLNCVELFFVSHHLLSLLVKFCTRAHTVRSPPSSSNKCSAASRKN